MVSLALRRKIAEGKKILARAGIPFSGNNQDALAAFTAGSPRAGSGAARTSDPRRTLESLRQRAIQRGALQATDTTRIESVLRPEARQEVATEESQFLLGSTTGSASFTPSVSSSVVNPQSRSIIRIDTSQSGLANNLANITLNVLVRDQAFLGKTITVNVIDANTGLRFSGSTSNFILRDREQRVSNIVWIEKRERISGQVILSLQGQDFSRGANFEFQSTTIPDKDCLPNFHKDENGVCVPDLEDEEEDTGRNLFNTAIIGAIGLGVLASIGGFGATKKRRKR